MQNAVSIFLFEKLVHIMKNFLNTTNTVQYYFKLGYIYATSDVYDPVSARRHYILGRKHVYNDCDNIEVSFTRKIPLVISKWNIVLLFSI